MRVLTLHVDIDIVNISTASNHHDMVYPAKNLREAQKRIENKLAFMETQMKAFEEQEKIDMASFCSGQVVALTDVLCIMGWREDQ
jgi:hypothetical protein